MANVLTMFFHGTNYSRDADPTKDELITYLSEHVKGDEARIEKVGEVTKANPLPYGLKKGADPTYLILEGPGSSSVKESKSKAHAKTAHHAPGERNPLLGIKKKSIQDIVPSAPKYKGEREVKGLFGQTKKEHIAFSKEEMAYRKQFYGLTAKPHGLGGLVYGTGWEDNVYKAVFLITHLLGTKQQPKCINMVGWSRGAVTCLMTAHKLFEVFDYTINVNIFAADPVPGGMTTITDNMCHITPNVRNLFVILATGDARSNFVPLDRKTLRILTPRFNDPLYIAPHVHMLPMPGNHTDVVLGYQPSCWGVVPGGLIVRHLAWKFLKFHGTQFEPQWEKGEAPDWKPDILVHYYELMMKNAKNNFEKAKYVALLDKIAAGRELTRDVHLYRNLYVTDEKQHMNEHHRFCLSKSFPRVMPSPPPPPEIPKEVLEARAKVKGAPYLQDGTGRPDPYAADLGPPKQASMAELGISYK